MKNAMQLKALVKNIAKEKSIPAQIVMQNYMLERLLERISLSKYQSRFILKGGFLIAAIVGLDTRATMDMDATLKGLPVGVNTIKDIFEEICEVAVDDDISFRIKGVTDIRETDEYAGIRVSLEAQYPPLAVPLKVDVTSGDKITPREIEYTFNLLFEPRTIKVLAYNMETVLAEKIETVISRGIFNTRPRDYYDIYILKNLQWQNVDTITLSEALKATATKRGSMASFENSRQTVLDIRNDLQMIERWEKYRKEFEYAKDIPFNDVCDAIAYVLSEAGI